MSNSQPQSEQERLLEARLAWINERQSDLTAQLATLRASRVSSSTNSTTTSSGSEPLAHGQANTSGNKNEFVSHSAWRWSSQQSLMKSLRSKDPMPTGVLCDMLGSAAEHVSALWLPYTTLSMRRTSDLEALASWMLPACVSGMSKKWAKHLRHEWASAMLEAPAAILLGGVYRYNDPECVSALGESAYARLADIRKPFEPTCEGWGMRWWNPVHNRWGSYIDVAQAAIGHKTVKEALILCGIDPKEFSIHLAKDALDPLVKEVLRLYQESVQISELTEPLKLSLTQQLHQAWGHTPEDDWIEKQKAIELEALDHMLEQHLQESASSVSGVCNNTTVSASPALHST